jgi:hypothetical protein
MPSHVQVERVPEIPGDVRFLVLIPGADERILVVREDALTRDETTRLAAEIAECPDVELPGLLRSILAA